VFSPTRKSTAQAGQGNVLKLAEISYRQELPMAHLPRSAGTLQALFQLAQSFFGWLAHSGRWPALRHSCGETGRTAREQARHFRTRLSGTPVAPCAA